MSAIGQCCSRLAGLRAGIAPKPLMGVTEQFLSKFAWVPFFNTLGESNQVTRLRGGSCASGRHGTRTTITRDFRIACTRDDVARRPTWEVRCPAEVQVRSNPSHAPRPTHAVDPVKLSPSHASSAPKCLGSIAISMSDGLSNARSKRAGIATRRRSSEGGRNGDGGKRVTPQKGDREFTAVRAEAWRTQKRGGYSRGGPQEGGGGENQSPKS